MPSSPPPSVRPGLVVVAGGGGGASSPPRRAADDYYDDDDVRLLRLRPPRRRRRDDVRRSFSSSAAAAVPHGSSESKENEKKKEEKEKEKKEEKKGDDSNIFLDNLGKIFLSTIGIVLVSLLRSTKSNNSRTALREDVESASLLDPLEIDDLRLANQDFTIEVWEAIIRELREAFPSDDRRRGGGEGRAVTYPEFLSVVTRAMGGVGGEGFTIQFGHLVDRVVIAELERIGGGGGVRPR